MTILLMGREALLRLMRGANTSPYRELFSKYAVVPIVRFSSRTTLTYTYAIRADKVDKHIMADAP